MYHADLVILQTRYHPQAILSMLVYCDLVYLAYYELQEEKDQMASKVVDYIESPNASDEQHGVGHTSDLGDTLRSFKEEIRSCKEDNDRIIQTQENKSEVNAILLQSFTKLQRQEPLRINHAHEDGINGAYGNISPSRRRSDRSEIVRDGRLLDTPERRGNEYKYYSSSGYDRHHDHHCYHPYRRNDKGILTE